MEKTCHNTRDSYKSYKEKTNKDLLVNIATYHEVACLFMAFLSKLIIEGVTINISKKLGFIGVIGRKKKVFVEGNGNVNNLAADWKKTKELWASNPEAKEKKQLVYHLDEHSNFNIYKTYWNHKQCLTSNIIYYSFDFSRTNDRKLAQAIKSGTEYSIDNKLKR